MSSTEPYQPDELTVAISAALDDLIGPVPDEIVEEQAAKPSRPPARLRCRGGVVPAQPHSLRGLTDVVTQVGG